MHAAIATFGNEVSPRFCCAREALLVEVVDGREVDRSTLVLGESCNPDRLRILEGRGVTVLLCGGFDRRYLPEAERAGIRAVVEAVDRIPVIANGDIRTIADAAATFEETGCAAVSIGKPGATMTGDLPPSSRVTGVRLSEAARITSRPTPVEPLKSRWSNGWAAKARATSTPPFTTATRSLAK